MISRYTVRLLKIKGGNSSSKLYKGDQYPDPCTGCKYIQEMDVYVTECTETKTTPCERGSGSLRPMSIDYRFKQAIDQ